MQPHSTLAGFADWTASTDPHAEYRLPILRTAIRILEGGAVADSAKRQKLADRLERWRYQMLNHSSSRLGPREQELADTLDLAANELFNGPTRSPRSPRRALASPDRRDSAIAVYAVSPEAGSIEPFGSVESYLSPETPLAGLVHLATKLTTHHFSEPRGATVEHESSQSPERGGSQTGSRTQRRMRLYAPLYLSSHCTNHCVYCSFQYRNQIEREHLIPEQSERQALILRERGFRHVLLVAGDFPRLTNTAWLVDIIRRLARHGLSIAVEVAPQSTASDPRRGRRHRPVSGRCGSRRSADRGRGHQNLVG